MTVTAICGFSLRFCRVLSENKSANITCWSSSSFSDPFGVTLGCPDLLAVATQPIFPGKNSCTTFGMLTITSPCRDLPDGLDRRPQHLLPTPLALRRQRRHPRDHRPGHP